MCMFCAAVPVAGALGAKLNADQNRRADGHHLPISKLTGLVVTLLVICSVTYHTLTYRS